MLNEKYNQMDSFIKNLHKKITLVTSSEHNFVDMPPALTSSLSEEGINNKYLNSSDVFELHMNDPVQGLFHTLEESDENLIIIERPEIALHPSDQIEMMRYIVKFVNENDNKKICLFTHSDYMVRELNALIALGSLIFWDYDLRDEQKKYSVLESFNGDNNKLIKHDHVSLYGVNNGFISDEMGTNHRGLNCNTFDNVLNDQSRLFSLVEHVISFDKEELKGKK